MWYINGWVESIVLRHKAGDFFLNVDKRMKKTGVYIIKDKFFEDTSTGTYWMIPLSSQISKYK